MLSEFLHNLHEPSRLPPDVPRDSPMFSEWRSRRERYEEVRDGYMNHLRSLHGVDHVTMQRIEHRMPGIPEVLGDGITLQDERLYRQLPDGPEDLEGLLP